jgi:hypothetical protein
MNLDDIALLRGFTLNCTDAHSGGIRHRRRLADAPRKGPG